MLPMVDETDVDLLLGGVPQLADWIRAWQACQCPASYHKEQKQGVIENFFHGFRGRGETERRAFEQMVMVMSCVVRFRLRQHLEQAYAITLLLDDRGPYRLVRFKCDAPRPEGQKPSEWRGSVAESWVFSAAVVFWRLGVYKIWTGTTQWLWLSQ